MKTIEILAFLIRPGIVVFWKMAEGGGKPEAGVHQERGKKLRDSNLAYSLRINLTALMRILESRVPEMEVDLDRFITNDQILRVDMIVDSRRKVNMILRYVLQRTDSECESFMRYLIGHNYFTEKDLQECKRVPDVADYKEVTVDDFNRPDIQQFIEQELEVTTILDYLYEWFLINLHEYENIEKAKKRKEKVRILLSILQRRCDDRWTRTFCYILNTVGHQTVLRGMQNIKNVHQIGIQESDIPVFGKTFKLDTDHQTQLALREQSAVDLNNQWQHADHRITGTRPGCVEFLLLSRSQTACKLLDKDDQEEKCRTFLQSLTLMPDVKKTLRPGQIFKIKVQRFDSSLPLVAEENAKTLGYRLAINICKYDLIVNMNFEVVIEIMVELNMIDHSTVTKLSATLDENLKKEYVIYLLGCCEEDKLELVLIKAKESWQLKQFVDQIEQRRCIECYRRSLLTLYQEVEDEIDTEIMEKTLQGDNDVPDLLTNVCIHKARKLSRADRAKIFLQYILTNENILLRFVDVFATMSKVVLTHTSCVYCTHEKSNSALTDDTLAYTFVVEDANVPEDMLMELQRKLLVFDGQNIINVSVSFLSNLRRKGKITVFWMRDKFWYLRDNKLVVTIITSQKGIELERFTDSEACIRVMMLGNPVACRCVWNLFQNESGIIKAERSEKVLRREEKFKGQRYLLNAVKSENCKDLVKDLTNYAVLVSPGPHIIMILMTAGHNPSEVLNDIIAVHGNDIEKYVLLVFLNSLNGSASEEDEIRHVFATDAKRRKTNYIFLNTRDMDNTIPKQMNSLLEKIEDVTKNNDMTYYTHKIFDQTEVEIQNALKEKESRQHLDNLHMKRKEIDEELMLIQEPEIAHRKEKLREQIVLKSLKIILEGNENLQAG